MERDHERDPREEGTYPRTEQEECEQRETRDPCEIESLEDSSDRYVLIGTEERLGEPDERALVVHVGLEPSKMLRLRARGERGQRKGPSGECPGIVPQEVVERATHDRERFLEVELRVVSH